MSNRTDAYEIYDQGFYKDLGYSMDNRDHRPYNGSTKLITSLLALMNILLAAAVVGGVATYGKVQALEVNVEAVKEKVDLVISGRIHIASGP